MNTVLSLGFGHRREQIIQWCWIHDFVSFQKCSLIKSAPESRLFTSGSQALCKCFFFPHLFRGTQNYPQVGKSTFYCLLGVVTTCHLSDYGVSYPSGEDHLKRLPQKGLSCLWWAFLFVCFALSRIHESTRTFLGCFPKNCFGLFL